MARALQDGSRAEPTAAVSGSPACPVGGTVALPPSVCRPPLAWPPGLNCIYRCGPGQEPPRSRLSGGRGNVQPATHSGNREGASTEPEQGPVQSNGHILPRNPPSLEQAIGAHLRRMGDQFHQEHERREHRLHGALWGHLHHLVFQLLGILYNLPARG